MEHKEWYTDKIIKLRKINFYFYFLNSVIVCSVCCTNLLQLCLTLHEAMDYSPPGSPAHGFSRQEYWSGLPFPPPDDLPDLHWICFSCISCTGRWFFTTWVAQELLSVQFRHSVVSDSLRPHESQHTKPPCPSPTPRINSNSCPLSQWCHPTISSSVVCLSSHLQSFPASGSFPMSQPLASGGQSIGVSASASVLPVNIQDCFPLGWTDWISLQSKGLSRVFSNTTVQMHQFFSVQLSLQSNSHIHTWLLKKP